MLINIHNLCGRGMATQRNLSRRAAMINAPREKHIKHQVTQQNKAVSTLLRT